MSVDIAEISKILENKLLIDWETIPDFGLYMEQAMGVLNEGVQGTNALTSNMVNNYVKDGYISRPEQKKYTRDQLVRLFILMQAKSVLSIPEIAASIDSLGPSNVFYEKYDELKKEQHEFLQELENRISLYITDKRGQKGYLALQLSLEGCLLRRAAELLIARESDHGPQFEVES